MSKNCAKAKPKIMSHITFNKLFFNNDDMCRNFFLNVFHPLGLVCPECGCVHFTLLKCRNNVYTCSQCSHQVYLFYRNYLSGQQITIIYTSLWYISFYNVQRFGELMRRLDGITQSTLTKQLRELEEDGFLHREIYKEVPPKVEYTLTEIGKSFVPILHEMMAWSETHLCPAGYVNPYSSAEDNENITETHK